jgi:exonuclease III
MSDTLQQLLSFLCWNVRGLNDPDCCTTVNETIASSACTVACLQESKLQNLDASSAAFIGGFRLRSFVHLPAVGTKGGVIILWDDTVLQGTDVLAGTYCQSLTLTSIRDDFSFRLTSVYGPSRHSRKEEFFAELIDHKPPPGTKWMVNGDFNQIY